MPIGSSKLGVLGAGLVPGGTETFNAPGTFSIPPGVKKVSITGKGGTGNPGVAGNPGNPGNLGNGAGGGAGATGGFGTQGQVGGLAFIASNSFTKTGRSGPNLWISGQEVIAGGRYSTSVNNPGQSGCQGNSGNAGSVGDAGTAGNTGQSSSALCNTFPGGAGGNAPPGGNAGNAGTGGQGGGGGLIAPPSPNTCAGAGGAGGNGGGAGGAGSPSDINLPCYPTSNGGWGGGGASANADGQAGVSAVPAARCNAQRGAGGFDNNCVFPNGFNIIAANRLRRSVATGNCPLPNTSPTIVNNIRSIAGGFGGACTGSPVANVQGAAPGCLCVSFTPSPSLNYERSNPVYISGIQFRPGSPPQFGPQGPGIFSPCEAIRPGLTDNSNIFRAGGGGGGGSVGSASPSARGSGGGGGGGGRGNAGNAGGPSPTISGSAANPVTYNCVPVTPGTPTPITVGTPGGQVVISWNPQ
jgi:hypothetical protein